jgi:hypothetical protein
MSSMFSRTPSIIHVVRKESLKTKKRNSTRIRVLQFRVVPGNVYLLTPYTSFSRLRNGSALLQAEKVGLNILLIIKLLPPRECSGIDLFPHKLSNPCHSRVKTDTRMGRELQVIIPFIHLRLYSPLLDLGRFLVS